MSRLDHWMPLYIGDYLADTMHLDAQQHGAYLLLIMHYWRSGPLPDDDRFLAAVARVEPAEWATSVGPVVRAFFRLSRGRLTHRRVDIELARVANVVKKRRLSGKKGGIARAEKAKQNQCDAGTCQPVATALPENCHVQPQPQSQKEERKVPTTSAPAEPSPAWKVTTPQDRLWAEGVPILRQMTGQPDSAIRKLVGVLRKGNRDDCARTLALIREARDRQFADPVAWLVAASRPKPSAADRVKASYRRTLEIAGLLDDAPDLQPMGLLQ